MHKSTDWTWLLIKMKAIMVWRVRDRNQRWFPKDGKCKEGKKPKCKDSHLTRSTQIICNIWDFWKWKGGIDARNSSKADPFPSNTFRQCFKLTFSQVLCMILIELDKEDITISIYFKREWKILADLRITWKWWKPANQTKIN